MLNLLNPTTVIPKFDPSASAWFKSVEAASSVFLPGAKAAYNKFFISQKANGNLAAFNNGMLLSFAGFTGLNGCFVPLISRSNTQATNIGFVSGNKSNNWLQGTGSARIGCNIGLLAGQQNNNSMFFWATDTVASTEIRISNINPSTSPQGYLELISVAAGIGYRSITPTLATRTFEAGISLVNRVVSTNYDVITQTTSTSESPATTTINTQDIQIFGRTLNGGSNGCTTKMSIAGWGDSLPNPLAFRGACLLLMNELGVTI